MDKKNQQEDSAKHQLDIYTYNVRGLRDKTKRQRLFAHLKNKMKGIIFLQETHTIPGDLSTWQKEWQGEVFLSSGTSQSKGVTILMSQNIEFNLDTCKTDTDGRYILVKGSFNGHQMNLLNLYAPTADKKEDQNQFLDSITELLETNSDNMVIGETLTLVSNR